MANSGSLTSIEVSTSFRVYVAPQNLSPDIDPWIQVIGGGNNYYLFGSSAGQINTAYSYKRTVPSSTSPDTFAISGTALEDPAGNSVGFAHVGVYRFVNLDSTQTLTVKAAAVGGVPFLPTNGISLPPGAEIMAMDPKVSWKVVAGSGDKITVTAAAGTNVAYLIELLGCDV